MTKYFYNIFKKNDKIVNIHTDKVGIIKFIFYNCLDINNNLYYVVYTDNSSDFVNIKDLCIYIPSKNTLL